MTDPQNPRYGIVPVGWILAVTALLGWEFLRLPWPFIDLYNSFYKATTMTWADC